MAFGWIFFVSWVGVDELDGGGVMVNGWGSKDGVRLVVGRLDAHWMLQVGEI